MALYGILKNSTNTGLTSELQAIFATPLKIISNSPAFISDTVSLRRRTTTQNVHRWEIEAAMMFENNSANFLSHSVRYNYTQTIYIRMPQPYRASGRFATGVVLRVNGATTAGVETLSIKGVGTQEVPVGEFITFAGDLKVYIITSATSPISGASTITVFPKLRSAKPDNLLITYGDAVTLRARYDGNNVIGITYRDGILAEPGSFKFIEEL